MDIALKLNVVAICAAFVFVGAIILGAFCTSNAVNSEPAVAGCDGRSSDTGRALLSGVRRFRGYSIW